MQVLRDVQAIALVFSRAIKRRITKKKLERALSLQQPLPPQHFKAAVYFADSPVNIYQMRQWYAPMEELNKENPVVIITRNPSGTLELLQETSLPVAFFRTIAEVEAFLEEQQIAAVFYVNQNTRNFQMMRFRKPAHVFISHGESDKDYMASNQIKSYDKIFIAGQAARDRINRLVLDYRSDDHLVEIGRPQVDVTYEAPQLPVDDRINVLYAPTWEGDRPSMEYSSLQSHGLEMIQKFVESGRHRVIYRPHPRTGAFSPEFRKASHDVIVQILNDANAKDPAAQHMVDTETGFGWHLQYADACICDISAVAFDWLATGKPMFLTEPASITAEVDRNGLPGMIETLKSSQSAEIIALLDAEIANGTPESYSRIAKHYFGDVTPGASMAKWLGAANQLISSRTSKW